MKLVVIIAVLCVGAAVALAVAVRRPAPEVHVAPRAAVVTVVPQPVRTVVAPVAVEQITGREGTAPGEMEEFARASGMPLALAIEQHRSTLLEERTADPKRLEEILGEPPSAEMLAAIHAHLVVMHDATANVQVHAREGRLSERDAIDQTRAAEDAYLQGVREATGLTAAQLLDPAP